MGKGFIFADADLSEAIFFIIARAKFYLLIINCLFNTLQKKLKSILRSTR